MVQITDAYTVSPTILALRIETGEVIRGTQTPYIPEPGDRISDNHVVIRDGEAIGQTAANDTVLRTFDEMIGPELDTTWADQASSYTLTSTGDSDFSQGITPTKVFRKSKPGNIAETGPWDFEWPMEHTIFLELPEPLAPNQTYDIDFSGDRLQDTAFKYEPDRDRSEAVHVSHQGFAPNDPAKVAFLSTWMGGEGEGLDYQEGQKFWLIDQATGAKVYEGAIELSKDQNLPEDNRGRNYNGTNVYMMDFSDFDAVGTYQVAVEGVGTSFAFDIDNETWADSFYVSARGMYHQRSGIELEAPYTDYERPRPFHPDDGVKIYESTATLMDTSMGLNSEVNTFDALVEGKTDELVPEAWGGWFDAGDWDRRIQHLDVTRSMLELAELFPDYFSGVDLNLPESDNSLPDVIDEALWGLDFFKRLQLPNGGVRGGVESAEHPERYEASWQESLDIMAYAPDMWSSYKYAATAAYAAFVLQDIDSAKAQEYEDSALKAMEWAEAEFSQIDSGDQTYTEVDDERSLAAAELYRLSGSDRWHQVFLETTVFDDPSADIYTWQSHNRRDSAFVYARTEQPGIDSTVQTNAQNALLRTADDEIGAIANTGFKWNKDPWVPLGWGSSFGAPNNRTLFRAHSLSSDEKYLKSGILATQFALGANPDNTSYTTGLGQRSPESPLILDSIAVGSEPPPGITLYGPLDMLWQSDYWAIDLFDDVTSPNPWTWPTTEGHFDVHWLIPHSEFTVMQSIGPMSYSLGYLAALNESQPGEPVTPTPEPIPIPEPIPTPEPVPTPEPIPEPIPQPDAESIGEYGTVELNDRWQTIELDATYDNPVVIVSDPTLNGEDPAAVRLRNVTDDTFQLRLQEPNYADGTHHYESVTYLVMEAGDWTLADGTRLAAGTHDSSRLTSAGFDQIELSGFDSTPTLLSQVQTFNGSDWVTTRTTRQSATSFQLAMQEEEALNDGMHVSETVGWLAVERGVAIAEDTLLQAQTTEPNYSDSPSTVDFQTDFAMAPSVIAKLGSYVGGNTANVRLDDITTTGFGVGVHEERSLDDELNHQPESIAFLALEGESGTLTARSSSLG